MKNRRILTKLPALLLTLALLMSMASAGSLFPTADNLFGVAMPDMRFAVGREPDGVEAVDGGEKHIYRGFTAEEYALFGRYAAAEGMTLDGFVTENRIFTAVLSLNGASVTMGYAWDPSEAWILYPENTRPERVASQAEWPRDGILPNISRAFGVPVPRLETLLPGHPAAEKDRAKTFAEKAWKKRHDLFRYTGITVQDYNAVGECLARMGYSAGDSRGEDGVLYATVTNSNGALEVSYDLQAQVFTFFCPELYYLCDTAEYDAAPREAAEETESLPGQDARAAASALPDLREMFSIPMPSLGEVLHRYPDEVARAADGSQE